MDNILFVDDETRALEGYNRTLRNKFNITLAASAKKALELIETKEQTFAVIVSDYRMPEMNGIEFLSIVKEKIPDTIRIMLTGQSEIDVSINAINKGHIFQFITKPCPNDNLVNVLSLAIRQYQLITAEKELLEKTLNGSIKVLIDILNLLKPKLFNRVSRIKRHVLEVVNRLQLKNTWIYEVAAMLSGIGLVFLDEELIARIYTGKRLTPEEYATYVNANAASERLLSVIPRLENVAKIIGSQHLLFKDYVNLPENFCDYNEIQIGAQILKIATDLENFLLQERRRDEIIRTMISREGYYNPIILQALKDIGFNFYEFKDLISVNVKDLTLNMIVAKDIKTKDGLLVLAKDQEVTDVVIESLSCLAKKNKIAKEIEVKIVPYLP